jgi:hypothetical protein
MSRYSSLMLLSKLVGLITTLHDPDAAYAPYVERHWGQVRRLYAFAIVIATPQSGGDTIDALRRAGAHVLLTGTPGVGESRRRAVAAGLAHVGRLGGDVTHLHYCDLDRLLHWQMTQPAELHQIVEAVIPQSDYCALGRTPRAFDTHPPAQTETESLTNEVFSTVLGREMDVTAGSCGMSTAAAALLLRSSVAFSNATDCEWPLLVAQAPGMTLAYRATDGLAFETATFFGPEVFAAAQSDGNWRRRVRLARESIAATLRLGRVGLLNGG